MCSGVCRINPAEKKETKKERSLPPPFSSVLSSLNGLGTTKIEREGRGPGGGGGREFSVLTYKFFVLSNFGARNDKRLERFVFD